MNYSSLTMLLVPLYLIVLLLVIATSFPVVGFGLMGIGLAMIVWPIVRLFLSIEFGGRDEPEP